MLLSEITYSILELIRNGGVVDDERLDHRLIEEFVRTYRAVYIKELADTNKLLQEDFYQFFNVDILGKVVQEGPSTVYQTVHTPKIVHSRYGPLLSEVTFLGNPLHVPFKVVNNHHFRFTGEGRFNRNLTYVTYRDGKLFLKSSDNNLSYTDKIGVKAIIDNPENIQEFNKDEDDYPITYDAYNFIKNELLSKDISIFVSGDSDKVNDSSGKILQ
jgi:hypothetical protein